MTFPLYPWISFDVGYFLDKCFPAYNDLQGVKFGFKAENWEWVILRVFATLKLSIILKNYGIEWNLNDFSINCSQQAGYHKINSPFWHSVELQKKIAKGEQGASEPRSCFKCNVTISQYPRSIEKPSLSSMPQITPEGVSM